MISTTCQCGSLFEAAESDAGQLLACNRCGQPFHLVAAEDLPEGAGAGDFDARLVVVSGPDHVGEHILLGGVQPITIGKLPDRHIVLGGGKMVSRHHCTLDRLDFGPSRWKLSDNASKNGLWVNGNCVESVELTNSDQINVGDYQLKFQSTFEHDLRAAKAVAAKQAIAAGAPVCPSCNEVLPMGAKICVACGVDAKTGRSLVMSKGMDEDDLAVRADTWIRTLSWIIPFGLFPIASEALGTKKPLATWVIFGITVVASLLFTITIHAQGEDVSAGVLSVLQWNGDMRPHTGPSPGDMASLRKEMADEGFNAQEIEAQIQDMMAEPAPVGFHWYQLLTSATLHDPDLLMPFIMHLGGNMLFLLVFGLRVNELIGTWRMAVVYPLLAVASGLAHHITTLSAVAHPSLGASGAVMGLAGMYFVFFPVQRVHMTIWFRGGFLTGWRCFYKVFKMRGFWLLMLWIGLNDVLPVFIGLNDNVAHWAHLGGFMTGAAIALLLLLTRQISAHGNDILSVTLGKRAWSLLGKPAAHLGAAGESRLFPERISVSNPR